MDLKLARGSPPGAAMASRRQQRIAAGERAGYETVKGGYALSAPKYYQLFAATCLEMITKYGVNQFKFDGTGNASTVFPGSLFDSDFSAAIHLIERLRQQETADLYQPDDGDVAVAVLAAVCGLDLAQRRRP